MKQSTSNGTQSLLRNLLGDAAVQVSYVLLQLPQLVLESDSRYGFPFTWGAKRMRSVIDSNPSPSSIRSTPSQPSIPAACVGDDEKHKSGKPEVTSPATPLSFSPSESDGKSKHRNISKKRKEEWLETIDDLTQRREWLKVNIETVRRSYDKLRALNLELKARKQQLSLRRNKEKPCLEINKNSNLAMEAQPTVKSPTPIENQDHQQIRSMAHQQPLITAFKSVVICENIQYPVGIPDLNLSLEENVGVDSLQPLDMISALTKAKAAQARKERMKIYKVKNSIAATKPRYGNR